MKNSKLSLSAAVAVSAMLGIGAASAADLPMKALPMASAPAFSWTGCYIGVHAGAGVLHDQGFQAIIQAPSDRHGVGGLAGGQIGCNYQTGRLVFGIEGEGFWSGMKVTQDAFGGGINGNTIEGTASIKNKWDYDFAARFGIALDRALIYGKAGWVFGGFDWNYADTFPGTYRNQASATLDGLLIGVGLEYAFTNNWTAKFEYDYLGFNAQNVHYTEALTCSGPCKVLTGFTQNVSADKHIFKVGLNYLFNPKY
jgi:outer membrane immunogenic protein